jgi:sigma-B regulation protein RsbU (phosphoserine phosphatase)
MNEYPLLSTLNLCLGGLVFLLGFVILRENPGQRVNRLVALMLFFGGLGAILGAASFLPGRAAGATHRDFLADYSFVWEFFFPTLFLFASVFPEERAFARHAPAVGFLFASMFPEERVFARRAPAVGWRFWTPGFTAWVLVPHVFHFALMVVSSVWRPAFTIPDVGPLRYFGPLVSVLGVIIGLFLKVHRALFSFVNLGFGLATMALLFDSYRRARVPRLKQQLLVIAIGLSACLVCYSLATSIPDLFSVRINDVLRSGLTVAALTLGPGSIAYSIVRYKFLDAKLLARRGILYALASAVLVGVYLAVVSRLNLLVAQFSGADTRVFEPVFLIMAVALFQPAIARLEELLDQMVLKDPGDYRNVVRQLGRELQTTIDLEVLLSRTIRTLADALLLRTAHVVALTPGGTIARTGAGDPPGDGALRRLAEMLPRVSPRQSAFRLSDRAEGLSSEEQALLAGELGLSLLVPLRWRGDTLGAILLGEKVTGMVFTSEDVSLLTTLAAQVSVSLQNALLLQDRVAVARFEEELNLARQIQRTSLLSEFPAMPGYEGHALYIPSKHVGGDFYDVVSTGNGSHLVAIADVSGKGVPAALLSAMLQAALRTQAETPEPLSGILRNINSLLFRSTALQQFATFFLARIDGVGGRMTFSNAGHNWPMVIRPDGERIFLERGGTVLGILENVEFEEAQITLSPGDRIVLYTDGISEATNREGEQFGDRRLCDIVGRMPRDLSAREIAESVLDALREFLGEVEPQDDMTLLVLRVLEPVPAEVAELTALEAVAAL